MREPLFIRANTGPAEDLAELHCDDLADDNEFCGFVHLLEALET